MMHRQDDMCIVPRTGHMEVGLQGGKLVGWMYLIYACVGI